MPSFDCIPSTSYAYDPYWWHTYKYIFNDMDSVWSGNLIIESNMKMNTYRGYHFRIDPYTTHRNNEPHFIYNRFQDKMASQNDNIMMTSWLRNALYWTIWRGNAPATGGFSEKAPVMQSFDDSFGINLSELSSRAP